MRGAAQCAVSSTESQAKNEVPRVHLALKATMTGASSMRILLVEDEQNLASALTTALEHEAYAVDLRAPTS